jgi:hypothetical protein
MGGQPFVNGGEIRMSVGQKKNPPFAATSEGHTEAFETKSISLYSGIANPIKDLLCRGHNGGGGASSGGVSSITYRTTSGLEWRYKGKRARVLAMLAGTDSVTQWDTLPWHTRLGGTIHALRQDGLAIDTEREGEFRHARYRLRTPGTVEIHQETDEAAQ